MKNLMKTIATFLLLCSFTFSVYSQTKRSTITVLNIDTKGLQLDPQQMGNLVRIELEKLDSFDVTDRYDVLYLVDKNKLNIANCYGKMCLLEIGNTIKTDYMFTGSVELYGQTIITTFRLIDVRKEEVIRTTVMEFLNLPLENQAMIGISINKMFGKPNNEELLIRLTKKFDYENSINNPDRSRLNLQGPRFGYSFIFGTQAARLRDSKEFGGYDANPAMFQFGYQFEKQYLNEGNWQALFEFIPMVTGIDQQLVVPSVVLLNGFRNNKHGWEVAIGPAITLGSYSNMAKYNGHYYTDDQLAAMGVHIPTSKQIDSRGTTKLSSGLVLALGKTFKSGKMNIPLNLYLTIPSRDGFRVGISVGYNSKK